MFRRLTLPEILDRPPCPVFKKHNCTVRHTTYTAMARCIWRKLFEGDGDGPFAAFWSRSRHFKITLHETYEEAAAPYEDYARGACGYYRVTRTPFKIVMLRLPDQKPAPSRHHRHPQGEAIAP